MLGAIAGDLVDREGFRGYRPEGDFGVRASVGCTSLMICQQACSCPGDSEQRVNQRSLFDAMSSP